MRLIFFSSIKEAYDLNVSQDEFFDKLGDILWIDQDMLGIIDDLKRRSVLTFLITNMNPFHARYIRENYPELFSIFDYCMISCEEGVAKPDAEAFIRPLEHLGLIASDCIFIDDSRPNIDKASELGYRAFHYDVTDQYFCQNGKLSQERRRFRDYISLLDSHGLLFSMK